jgi:hypothetical protein
MHVGVDNIVGVWAYETAFLQRLWVEEVVVNCHVLLFAQQRVSKPHSCHHQVCMLLCLLLFGICTGCQTAPTTAKPRQAAAKLAGSAQGSTDRSVEWAVLPTT